MNKLWKLVVPMVSAIIGIAAISKWNFFAHLAFVPENMAYEIGITVYFAIADTLLDILKEGIVVRLKNSVLSEIGVIISLPSTEATVESTPIIRFNDTGQAEANITVKIQGARRHFKNVYLEIPAVSFATVQPTRYSSEVTVDGSGVYRINLEKLFAGNDRTQSETTFRIVLAQETVDGDRDVMLEPKIVKKKIWVCYKHNRARLEAKA